MSKNLTFSDLCLICAKRGIGIRIFVQDEHVGQKPALVTIQVSSRVKGVKPRAFITFVVDDDAQLDDVLATELRKYVDLVSSGLILPLTKVGNA